MQISTKTGTTEVVRSNPKSIVYVWYMTVLVSSWLISSSFSLAQNIQPDTNSLAQASAEEVVAKYLQAIGGVDAIQAIISKRITYKVHMFGRDAYLMEKHWTRSISMLSGPPGATTYTLTEGNRSWRVKPEGRQELPAGVAGSLSKLADIDGPLINSAEKGVTLSYSGLVHYDMTDLHQVTATFSDDVKWEFFFDTSTGLLRRMTQPSFFMLNDQIIKGPDVHYYYYDYQSVESVLYPYFWIQSTEDHMHLFVVEEIQIQK